MKPRIVVAVLLFAAAFWAAWSAVRAPQYGMGYQPNPEATREYLGELDHPTFRGAAESSMQAVEYRDVFLYRDVDKVSRQVYGVPFAAWDQGGIGSCVSFAFGLAEWSAQCLDYTTGRLAQPPPRVAPEPIYGGARTLAMLPPRTTNYGGDGTYGAAAARWITGRTKDGHGGILFAQSYGRHDLSTYSVPRCREYGRDGVPSDLLPEAAKLRSLGCVQVTTWEELCAALETGRPVVLCSTVGYGGTTVRDADGFLPRGSSWAHAMTVLAVRHAKNAAAGVTQRPRDGALIVNSWSPRWASGPKFPSDQPDGSFWAERRHVEAAMQQGDSFAVAGVVPLDQYRPVNHHQWLGDPAGLAIAP